MWPHQSTGRLSAKRPILHSGPSAGKGRVKCVITCQPDRGTAGSDLCGRYTFRYRFDDKNNLPCDTPPGRCAETVWLSCHMIELLQTPITITQTHLPPRIPALNRENNFCSGVEKGDQRRVIRVSVCRVCVSGYTAVWGGVKWSPGRPPLASPTLGMHSP
jgi:hypothetical protein